MKTDEQETLELETKRRSSKRRSINSGTIQTKIINFGCILTHSFPMHPFSTP